MLAVESEDPSSIPGTNKVEGKSQLPERCHMTISMPWRRYMAHIQAGIYPGIWKDAGCDPCGGDTHKVENGGGCVFLVDGG